VPRWRPRGCRATPALAARLEQAQAVLVETEGAVDPLAAAGWAGVDVSDATPAEARGRTLRALADRAYDDGSVAVVAVLATPEARARVEAAAPWLDALGADARRGYLVAAWVAAVVTLLLLVVLALVQQGWARVFVPGGVLLLAAAVPLATWWWWRGAAARPVADEPRRGSPCWACRVRCGRGRTISPRVRPRWRRRPWHGRSGSPRAPERGSCCWPSSPAS
jgi:SAM-dependent methyltransferase